MQNSFTHSLILAIVFSACSFKSDFSKQELKSYESFTKPVLSTSKAGIIFADKSIFSPQVDFKTKVEGDFLVLANQNHIITSNEDYQACIIDIQTKRQHCHQLQHQLISAAIQDNILAGLLRNNTFIIYDLKAAKLQFYKKQGLAKTFSTNIASPIFYKHIVIFPSLNGQLVFFDFKKKLFDKNIFLESSTYFDNINFLKVIDESLVAANEYQVLVIKDDDLFEYKASIKAMTNDRQNLFLALNDGSVVKLDLKLNQVKKVNFNQTKPIALKLNKQELSLLDARGYILRLDKNLQLLQVLKLYDDIGDQYYFNHQSLFYKQRLLYF